MPKQLFVYILAGWNRKLYTGVTNNLSKRLEQHRLKLCGSYTGRHSIVRLVYCERIAPPIVAIAREKQIKSWSRRKRIELIESVNPDWNDLSEQLSW